jgi:hypothetical protein
VGHVDDLVDLHDVGPPPGAGDHPRFHQFHPGEEPQQLIVGAQRHLGRSLRVPEADGVGHRSRVDLGGGMRDGQVAAGHGGAGQLLHDLHGPVGVHDEVHDPEHHDRDGLAEVQDPGRVAQDRLRVLQVGLDVVARALGGAGQQGAGVHQHQRVVVDVDDP